MMDSWLPNNRNLNFRIPVVIDFMHESGAEHQPVRPGNRDSACSRIQIGNSRFF